MTIEMIARVCYAANRQVNLETRKTVPDGKPYPTWEECSEADRAMFIKGARMVIDHPTWTDEEVHDFWMNDRLTNGWQKADARDYDAKTHQSLVPFSQLTVLEQCKDSLFRSVALALAPTLEESDVRSACV